MDQFIYFYSLKKCILVVLILNQPGPLAQSVERGADNAKVVSSRLTWTNFLNFIYSLKKCILVVLILDQPGPLAQSVERGADNAKVVSSRLTWTNFFLYLLLEKMYTRSIDT